MGEIREESEAWSELAGGGPVEGWPKSISPKLLRPRPLNTEVL